MIRLQFRGRPSPVMVYLSPVLAFLLTVLTGMTLFFAVGQSPLTATYTFFVSPLLEDQGFAELIVKATPLILVGLGLSLAFRANVWNIGAEGQLTMGAIFGGGLGIYAYESESALLLPAMLVLGVIGGLLWGVLTAFLKSAFHASEILTSLMLTYVAQLFLSYLVHGPWRDPEGYNFPESRLFADAATMPVLIDDTRLHLGAVFAVVAVVGTWLLLSRSMLGFQLEVLGASPRAARFAGFRPNLLLWFCMAISGGLAGLAGVSEVAGPVGQLTPSISPGYGFTAIIVAFLGRLSPIGVVFAGLIMALSYLGGETAQIALGVPAAVTHLFQGILLFFLLACDVLTMYRVQWGRPRLGSAVRG